ncbi:MULTISPECIES: gene transfer agent family protein [Rhizobium/Agrobacterium group]|uniref:gene transfer agent family protein n=1 Tax=Rhizobium/Agrobacterium group TaxID=227290 RepID=UPI002301978F|nr:MULTISPECIES: gene transfer agent family protein [Rhizobium/Agrobacterium group]MDA5632340.1 gene transfer agent family protein [Agrobacterium sp. ST15.16.024]MDF1888203.1 gene transfer agent family protein [Rhizobium rhizogenes]
MPQGLRYGRANRHRGEIEALIDGERRILCLTLGALAELETAFQTDDLTALAERFATGRMKAADMIRVIGAGLRGAGNVFSDEDVAAATVEGGIAGHAAIIADLLTATFGGPKGETQPDP